MQNSKKKTKSKLEDLQQRKIFLDDFKKGKKYWVNEINGLSLKQCIDKVEIEIEILNEILK